MIKNKISFLIKSNLCVYLICVSLIACTKNNYSLYSSYQFKSENKLPDYKNLNYWAAHPWKKDLSDSIPKPLLPAFKQDSLADVFFIHPTSLTSNTDQRWNAAIDDVSINVKTDYSSILYQASVFNEKCRVFAPRYRQAHIRAFFENGTDSEKAFEIAYTDIKTAFIYYLKNYNNDRPIIIASHSQGTKHATRLLKEFFEKEPLLNKLVCAYLIGFPVPVDYFIAIKPCEDALSTGCIISWRTYKSGSAEPKFIANETFNSVVTNPLSWTRNTDLIGSLLNKGGVLRNYNKIVPGVVNAQIHKNVLWTSKPNIRGKIFFTRTNYHIGDINLFYMNLRENATERIVAYLKNYQ